MKYMENFGAGAKSLPLSRVIVSVFLLLASIAVLAEEPINRDPWESFNRKVFAFNDVADQYFLAPVARGYRWVTPDLVESGVHNFFSNLGEVTTIANDLLQFKWMQAGNDVGRLLINSTVGIAGFFDVASRVGLEENKQDFGLTLARWGMGSGPFVMVPIIGPSTIRDGSGELFDTFTTNVIGSVDDVPTRNTTRALYLIDLRASFLASEDLISGDRYTLMRDVYLQHRDFLVNGRELVDDFGDDGFDDWEE